MITEIKEKIITAVQSVDDIVGTYGYPLENATGYPYAYVTWVGNTAERIDNHRQRIVLTYSIIVVQEKIEELKGRANAELTSEARAEAIEKKIRESKDLGSSNVLMVLPVRMTKRYDDSSTRIILEAEVAVELLAPFAVN
jgi:hypothetical protein